MTRKRSDKVGIDRVEALLRLAADRPPSRPAPVGLASRALAAQRRHPAPRLVPAFGVAALAIVLTVLVLPRQSATVRPVGAGIPAAPAHPLRTDATGTQRSSVSAGTSYMLARTVPTSSARSGPKPRRRDTERPRLARLNRVPAVRWSNERIEHVRSGVLTPAWATREDEATGTIVATPVLIERSNIDAAPGGGDTVRIIPASYNEVIR